MKKLKEKSQKEIKSVFFLRQFPTSTGRLFFFARKDIVKEAAREYYVEISKKN